MTAHFRQPVVQSAKCDVEGARKIRYFARSRIVAICASMKDQNSQLHSIRFRNHLLAPDKHLDAHQMHAALHLMPFTVQAPRGAK